MNTADSLWVGLAANYLGKAVTALLSLLTLPILFQQLGGEAFGLFAVFFSVQVLLGVFDVGIGAAVQRDLAALQAGRPAAAIGRVLATFRRAEKLLWAVGAGAIVITVAGGPQIAQAWVKVESLPVSLVAQALAWMGVAAALQFVSNFYVGCLNGLRRHRQANVLQAAVGGLRFVLLLWCVGVGVAQPGSMRDAVIAVFQVWAATNALLLVAARTLLLRALPTAGGPPGVASLRQALRFGLPLVAATTFIMLFNQVDKLAASRLLPLGDFGRYTIVWSMAEIMYLMYQPIYTSFLPLFCARHASAHAGDAEPLWDSIELAWRLLAIAVLPVAALLLAVPQLVILAWAGDASLVEGGAALLRWITVGAALNAFLFIPFALQQSAGDLRPWAWRIAVALAAYVPVAVYAIERWGATGAAASWCIGSGLLACWLARVTGRHVPAPSTGAPGFLRRLLPPTFPTLVVCALGAAMASLLPVPSGRMAAGASALLMLAGLAALSLRSQPVVWAQGLQWLARARNRAQPSAP